MIRLTMPDMGERIALLTKEQRDYLNADRADVEAASRHYLAIERQSGADQSLSRQVPFSWEAMGVCTLEISENEDFSSILSFEGEGGCAVRNLKCGTRYFWRVRCGDEMSEVRFFDTEARCPRFLHVEGLTNVRDAGGWTTESGKRIKQGMLYRGSEMNSHVNIKTEGLDTLRRELGLCSVLDLRGSNEEVEDVYRGRYLNVPLRPYRELFDHPEDARRTFVFLTDPKNYPVYYHCWGGADRTGTLAYMLGALLGMSEGDLIDDYELTSLSVWDVRSRNSELFRGFYERFCECEGGTPRQKARAFFLSCGVTEQQIEAFETIMLED